MTTVDGVPLAAGMRVYVGPPHREWGHVTLVDHVDGQHLVQLDCGHPLRCGIDELHTAERPWQFSEQGA